MTLTTVTRSQIETDVLVTLHRPDLATAGLIQTWFELAHRDVQEEYDWQCMQETAEIAYNPPGSVDVAGNEIVDRYPCPDDFKTPNLLYSFDKTAQTIRNFYNLTDIAVVRLMRSRPEWWPGMATSALIVNNWWAWYYWQAQHIYAIWNDTLELWPKPNVTDPTKVLRFDYYGWQSPPGESSFDWFTTNMRRFLQYKACLYSTPATVSDPRIVMWKGICDEAYKKAKAGDIATKWAGELTMRG